MKLKLLATITLPLFFSPFSFSQNNVKDLLEKAHLARQEMGIETAIELYTKVIELDPTNIDAYYYRADILAVFNATSSIEDFLKVIELDSLHEEALHGAAYYYSFNGNHEKAAYYLEKALAVNPQSTNNLFLQVKREIRKENYEKALMMCNQIISQQDESSIWPTLLERGRIYFFTGKNQEAISDFETCFKDDMYGKYCSQDFEMCGDAYEKIGELEQACEKWDLAINHFDVDAPSETAIQKVENKCKK